VGRRPKVKGKALEYDSKEIKLVMEGNVNSEIDKELSKIKLKRTSEMTLDREEEIAVDESNIQIPTNQS
jgi:hypothetical protein